MSTWFRVYAYGTSVSPIEVVSFTKDFLVCKVERAGGGKEGETVRKKRVTQWESFFPTESEAWDTIEKRVQDRYELLKAQLEGTRLEMQKISQHRKEKGV